MLRVPKRNLKIFSLFFSKSESCAVENGGVKFEDGDGNAVALARGVREKLGVGLPTPGSNTYISVVVNLEYRWWQERKVAKGRAEPTGVALRLAEITEGQEPCAVFETDDGTVGCAILLTIPVDRLLQPVRKNLRKLLATKAPLRLTSIRACSVSTLSSRATEHLARENSMGGQVPATA